MTIRSRIVGIGILSVFLGLSTVGAGMAAAPEESEVFVVQALPGEDVDVSVDGGAPFTLDARTVSDRLDLPPGDHVLTFTSDDDAWTMDVALDLGGAESTDVVIHRPASPDGDPVVTTYRNPLSPIAGDRGRVQVAHTATVPPADVLVDGDVVFANIANGEFARADVPAGVHDVAIVPTGELEPALLGPLPLEVEAATLTRVYAVGQPEQNSMAVVVASLPLPTSGSPPPDEVNTGSAGLVSDSPAGPAAPVAFVAGLLPVAAGVLVGVTLHRRRTSQATTARP